MSSTSNLGYRVLVETALFQGSLTTQLHPPPLANPPLRNHIQAKIGYNFTSLTMRKRAGFSRWFSGDVESSHTTSPTSTKSHPGSSTGVLFSYPTQTMHFSIREIHWKSLKLTINLHQGWFPPIFGSHLMTLKKPTTRPTMGIQKTAVSFPIGADPPAASSVSTMMYLPLLEVI